MATPPTLTAPSDVRLTQAAVLSFTDSALWRAAITAIALNGVALTVTTEYTVAAGVITILGSVCTKTGDYDVVITATGYTDATATITYGCPSWTQLSFGAAADVIRLEPVLSSTTLISTSNMLTAKEELKGWVESRFTSLQKEMDEEETDIVLIDSIKDVRSLILCFRHLCLSLAFDAGRVGTDNDLLGAKAVEHMNEALNLFHRWAGRSPFELGDYDRAHGTVRLVQ